MVTSESKSKRLSLVVRRNVKRTSRLVMKSAPAKWADRVRFVRLGSITVVQIGVRVSITNIGLLGCSELVLDGIWLSSLVY